MKAAVAIVRCASVEQPGWLDLRMALWPDASKAEHREEMAAFLREPARFAQLMACLPTGEPVGFVEVSVRRDYVNGTSSSPVGFLEGIYVHSAHRRAGIARTLAAAAESWAVEQGCREFASDALLENTASHSLHRALGYEETERVVMFRKATG